MNEKRLERFPARQSIAGVAAGFAAFFGTDIGLMRLLFFIAFLFTKGFAVVVYIALWATLPVNNSFSPITSYTTNEMKQQHKNGRLGGIILIIIGSLFLLENLNIFDWSVFGKLWPLILIATGAYILLKDRNNSNGTDVWNGGNSTLNDPNDTAL